jgi:hypothetical protein
VAALRVQFRWFPRKLYAILAQKEFHEIITWLPHGRSCWKVLKLISLKSFGDAALFGAAATILSLSG